MSARTRTDSHHRAVVSWPAGRVVAFSFSAVMALSGAWAPSAASAAPESTDGESEIRPSRGPKPPERWCSTGDDCPEDEPRGAASSGDQRADGRRAGTGPSSSPEARDPSREGQRTAPASPAGGRPAPGRPAPGSGSGPAAKPDARQARSQPSGDGPSGVDDPGSDGRGARGGPSPGTGSEQDPVARKSPSGGTGNALGGGRGPGTGGYRRPGGSAGAGRGGNHRASSAAAGRVLSGAGDGLPGFRNASVRRGRPDGPGQGSLRVPGSVLFPSPGIPSNVPSSNAAGAGAAPGPAAVAAPPIARSSGEISASTLLALLLLLVGWAVHRTVRAHSRPPSISANTGRAQKCCHHGEPPASWVFRQSRLVRRTTEPGKPRCGPPEGPLRTNRRREPDDGLGRGVLAADRYRAREGHQRPGPAPLWRCP